MTPNALRTRRKKIGWSQHRLSLNSGVGRYKIAIFELGYKQFTEIEVNRIQSALTKEEKNHAKNKKIES